MKSWLKKPLALLSEAQRTDLARSLFLWAGRESATNEISRWIAEWPLGQRRVLIQTLWSSFQAGVEEKFQKRLLSDLLATLGERKYVRALVTQLLDQLHLKRLPGVAVEIWQKLAPETQVLLRQQLTKTVPLDYAGAPLKIHCDSLTELRTRAHSVQKEPELVEWIEKAMAPGDIFYDIGANVGAYSLIAAAKWGGAVRVFAFEPSYPTFGQLVKNIFLNGLEKTITPLPLAIGDSPQATVSQMVLSSLEEGRAFNFLETFAADGIDSEKVKPEEMRRQSVLVHSLDSVIQTYRLPPPNHCKIDVDGFELPLLKGARQTLSDPRLRSLHLELNPQDADYPQIQALLAEYGWKIIRQTPRGGTTLNLLFARDFFDESRPPALA